jgi:hypothetical protein
MKLLQLAAGVCVAFVCKRELLAISAAMSRRKLVQFVLWMQGVRNRF